MAQLLSFCGMLGFVPEARRPSGGGPWTLLCGLAAEPGLEQYEPAFRDNHIDAELVLHLTGDDLKDLGVVSVGHRRKLPDAMSNSTMRPIA